MQKQNLSLAKSLSETICKEEIFDLWVKSHLHHEYGHSESVDKVYLNDFIANSINGLQSTMWVFFSSSYSHQRDGLLSWWRRDCQPHLEWLGRAARENCWAQELSGTLHGCCVKSAHLVQGHVSLGVGEESLRIRMSDPFAAVNRRIWILTFIVCSNKAAQWPPAKDHDTAQLPVDVCNFGFEELFWKRSYVLSGL